MCSNRKVTKFLFTYLKRQIVFIIAMALSKNYANNSITLEPLEDFAYSQIFFQVTTSKEDKSYKEIYF